MKKGHFIFILFCFFLFSCDKADNLCPTCVEMKIAGQLIEKESNKGLSNRKILVKEVDDDDCLACFQTKFRDIITDSLGHFNEVYFFDTLRYKSIDIYLADYKKDNYFYFNHFHQFQIKSDSIFIPFEAFKAANLKVNLKRTQNDKFFSAKISAIAKKKTLFQFDLSDLKQTDTTFQIKAPTATLTSFLIEKNVTNGIILSHDSILCKLNGINVINMEY